MSLIQAPRCAHCGAPSATRFCCAGCEGAHALVQGLGLDAFYRRREAADGALAPQDAPAADFAPLARPGRDGSFTLDLMVAGLTCGACVWLVEQALAAEGDVTRARANLSTRRLVITWRGPAARANALAALVARLGFRVAPFTPACLRATEDAEGRELTRALGVAAFGAMNVMLVSVAVWAGGEEMGPQTRHLMHGLAALIGVPVTAWAGMPLYRSAWRGLRQGRLTMDCAVSLGIILATLMSLSETWRNGDYTWFDGATALLALMLASRVLDRAARRRARQSVAELLALQDGAVTLADGRTLPVERVPAGARILVASGERLRLDAALEAGEALLDTAATTGESLPRPFRAGAALPAGAVNMGAPFTARVTAAAADGSLAAMARLLERAEGVRGRWTSLADRAARLYVPAAHLVALLTFLGWMWIGGLSWQAALVPAVAALIITCPCGLAIAVPAVQVVSVGALFRRGVLVGSETALERLATADHAVLDKTGTLTEGRPALLPGAWTQGDLRAAASLAAASRHPLAQALHAACPEARPAAGVEEHPGQGLSLPDGTRLGSARFCGVARDGGMSLHFARPGHAPVSFRFADRLRPDAAAAVAELRRAGLSVELLSGDGPAVVAAIAAEAGIDAWTAGATPGDKAARIAALAAEGRRVLMVGDGINDAAALLAAHVGAAPGEGTDLAQAAADLVLRPGGGLLPLAQAIGTARRAGRLARQNILFAFGYNIVAVPVAIAGHATPLMAALVMASSSLAVIGNALRAGRRAER